ncbi:hypothetical protein WMY93_002446 [Mugilogobius chulae]|uniref:Uncharacterized protein n=1 Tax=Mugilogobius chulae TaxID=88201 RepID=A0AAW0PVM4_9GOBI
MSSAFVSALSLGQDAALGQAAAGDGDRSIRPSSRDRRSDLAGRHMGELQQKKPCPRRPERGDQEETVTPLKDPRKCGMNDFDDDTVERSSDRPVLVISATTAWKTLNYEAAFTPRTRCLSSRVVGQLSTPHNGEKLLYPPPKPGVPWTAVVTSSRYMASIDRLCLALPCI